MLFNPQRHAADVMHLLGPNKPGNSVPGLPPVAGGRNPLLGATRTHLGGNRPAFVDVGARPSMKVQVMPGGGVRTIIKLNSAYAEFMTREEYRAMNQVMREMEAEARRLSQGSKSLKQLAAAGHPYGRGLKRGMKRGRIAPSGRAGVANKAIANKQSGQYLRLWKTEIVRGKTGADFILENEAPHAKYLLGTPRMVAHGPQTAAAVKYWQRLLSIFQRAAKDAKLRQSLMGGTG